MSANNAVVPVIPTPPGGSSARSRSTSAEVRSSVGPNAGCAVEDRDGLASGDPPARSPGPGRAPGTARVERARHARRTPAAPRSIDGTVIGPLAPGPYSAATRS